MGNNHLLHYKLQHATRHDLLMGESVILDSLPIQLHTLDVNLFRRFVRCFDDEVFSVFKVQSGLGEQRRTDGIFCISGMERIKAEG